MYIGRLHNEDDLQEVFSCTIEDESNLSFLIEFDLIRNSKDRARNAQKIKSISYWENRKTQKERIQLLCSLLIVNSSVYVCGYVWDDVPNNCDCNIDWSLIEFLTEKKTNERN